MNWSALNKAVVNEFRANAGRVARFGDLPIVILHTIGAKTQKILEVPLIAVLKDERMLLFATTAGSTHHPSWYYNLRAYPEIDVEFGSDRFKGRIIPVFMIDRV